MFSAKSIGIIAVIGFVALPSIGQEKAEPKKPDAKTAVMKKKLQLSQTILEGLALEDFDKIEKSAKDLVLVRQQAAFMVLKTPKYENYTNDFQKNLEEIQRAAGKKNVEAAALGYVEMTLTCVRCHQYVRDEKMGAAPRLDDLLKSTIGAE